jgi:molybdate/tungstate transport system permease protein
MRVPFNMDSLKFVSYLSITLLSVPIFVLLWYGFVVYRSAQGFQSAVFQSILLSLIGSLAAGVLNFLIFTPLAFQLSLARSSLLEAIGDLPASIPHPIVGIALLLFFSPMTPFGRSLIEHGFGIFDTIQGYVIALTIVSAPVYIRGVQSALESSPKGPFMLAVGLGASNLRALYLVVIPTAMRGVVSSLLTSTSRALSEFGSVAIVSYYVLQKPFFGIEPASVLVYEYYGYYGPGVAITAASVMVIVSLAMLAVSRLVGSRGRSRNTLAL